MRLEHFKSPLFLRGLPDLCNTLSPQTVECMGWVLMHRAVENQACSCILSGLGNTRWPVGVFGFRRHCAFNLCSMESSV